MRIRCGNCGRRNNIPDGRRASDYRCGACGQPLSSSRYRGGEASAAVGIVGGALLGAAIGGPVGAVIGGLIGGIIGKEAKGLE